MTQEKPIEIGSYGVVATSDTPPRIGYYDDDFHDEEDCGPW